MSRDQHLDNFIWFTGPGGLSWPLPGLLEQSVEEFARGFDAGVTGALIWLQQVGPLPPLLHSPIFLLNSRTEYDGLAASHLGVLFTGLDQKS